MCWPLEYLAVEKDYLSVAAAGMNTESSEEEGQIIDEEDEDANPPDPSPKKDE